LDHQKPWGTKQDNHTNKKFVTLFANRIKQELSGVTPGYLDLGCSGGQLVKDFRDLGWLAVGLEGFRTIHSNMAAPTGLSWAERNLFTCDITKPFKITARQLPARVHLVTMWEVLEHIHQNDLPQIFKNILGPLGARRVLRGFPPAHCPTFTTGWICTKLSGRTRNGDAGSVNTTQSWSWSSWD